MFLWGALPSLRTGWGVGGGRWGGRRGENCDWSVRFQFNNNKKKDKRKQHKITKYIHSALFLFFPELSCLFQYRVCSGFLVTSTLISVISAVKVSTGFPRRQGLWSRRKSLGQGERWKTSAGRTVEDKRQCAVQAPWSPRKEVLPRGCCSVRV